MAYFEPIDCTVEEAEEMKQASYSRMEAYDNQIVELRNKLSNIDECDPQNYEEVKELEDQIYYLSDYADSEERNLDYWIRQKEWAIKRNAKKLPVKKTEIIARDNKEI